MMAFLSVFIPVLMGLLPLCWMAYKLGNMNGRKTGFDEAYERWRKFDMMSPNYVAGYCEGALVGEVNALSNITSKMACSTCKLNVEAVRDQRIEQLEKHRNEQAQKEGRQGRMEEEPIPGSSG